MFSVFGISAGWLTFSAIGSEPVAGKVLAASSSRSPRAWGKCHTWTSSFSKISFAI